MTFAEMFGPAKWVEPDRSCTAPVIKGIFCARDVKKAQITICGLGFFRLWINEKEVSPDKYVPANSQYCKRNLEQFGYPIRDTLSYRTYCMRYDVTSLLREGENCVAAVLGTGWFAQVSRVSEGDVSYGGVKLCFKLDFEDGGGRRGCFCSDEGLRWRPSRIIQNSIYTGEAHDFSLGDSHMLGADFSWEGWRPVALAAEHESDFQLQTCPADRTVRIIKPKKIFDFGEYAIYDAGENISGYAVVASKRDGARLRVRYSEELSQTGELDFSSCGGEDQIQQELFLNAPQGEPCAPWFCWHGFRYFELSGEAEVLCCEVVNANVGVTSAFECDNEILNWLYDAFIRTQLSNMHCGVPSDCPHIERLGYTGDGQLCCEAAMLLLDSRSFYEKWLEDISDCQDVSTGHIQHTAPFAGGGGGPAGWGGAVVVVPYTYYKLFADRDVVRRFLPKILRYLDYMHSRSEGGLVFREEEGGWCLGDWCAPGRLIISESFVNTCLYIKYMLLTRYMASVIGEQRSVQHLDERISRARRGVEVAYFSPQTHSFFGGVQGADAFAADIGLGDGHTFSNIVETYGELGMYDTGIFATDILTRLLFERGEQDLAFELLTSRGESSFWNMMQSGATTIWERWDGVRSHSHPMFGAVTRYLFMFVLGIGQREDSAGFEHIVIEPRIPQKLGRASGRVETVRGEICVSFEREGDGLRFYIKVPQSAEFSFSGQVSQLKKGLNEIFIKG